VIDMKKLVIIALIFLISACSDKVLYRFNDGRTIIDSTACYGRVCASVKKLCHDEFCTKKTDEEIYQLIKEENNSPTRRIFL
jgi:hypothetical protein